MEQIILPRGTGKTLKLMQIAKEKQQVFVCANPYGMKQKAAVYGITGIEFISYEDFWDTQHAVDVVVDELEDLVRFIFAKKKKRLKGYTLTTGE